MPSFAPMLAAHAAEAGELRFPLLASPKLDGMRVSITERGPLTRNGHLLPNKRVREYLDRDALWGLDGELTWGDPVAPDAVQKSISAGMSENGPPPEAGLTFWVFDSFADPNHPFAKRFRQAEAAVKKARLRDIKCVVQEVVVSEAELDAFEARVLALGFEGVVIRRPEAPYTFGRAKAVSQDLLKLKRRTELCGTIVSVMKKSGGAAALCVRHPDWPDPFEVPLCGNEAIEIPRLAFVGRSVRFTRHPGSWKRAPRSPLFAGLEEHPMPRELIDTGTDKRYVRRRKDGTFKESDDVGRSLAADRRMKSKTVAKKGEGDRGDGKPRTAAKTTAKKAAEKKAPKR